MINDIMNNLLKNNKKYKTDDAYKIAYVDGVLDFFNIVTLEYNITLKKGKVKNGSKVKREKQIKA